MDKEKFNRRLKMPYTNPERYQSQKAKGIASLYGPCMSHLVMHSYLQRPGTRFQVLPYDEPDLPAFVRPCPTRPRHGFVESQFCVNLRQLLAIVHATARADPEAEIVLMEKIEGKYSGVLNNAGIAIGKGNDGATSGSNALFIPSPVSSAILRGAFSAKMLFYGSILQTPYLEFVQNSAGIMTCVQLRDGPSIAGARSFVPRKVKVRTVLQPARTRRVDDLLAWEREIIEAKGKPGVVAYLPRHPLSSHYAIHAISHGIPVVTSAMPEVGKVIQPTKDKPASMTKPQLRILARLMAYWLQKRTCPISGQSIFHNESIGVAVSAAHAQINWGGEWHLLHLRAFAVAIIARAVLCGCLGEARHFYSQGPGYRWIKGERWFSYIKIDNAWPSKLSREAREVEAQACLKHGYVGRPHSIPWEKLSQEKNCVPKCYDDCMAVREGSWGGKLSREQVFHIGERLPPQDLLCLSRDVAKDLDGPGWPGGYGGHNWATGAELARKLLASALAFIRDPSRERWQTVVRRLNNTVNSAHNGGDVLSKWERQHKLDRFAVTPAFGFTAGMIPEMIFAKKRWMDASAGAVEQLLAWKGPKAEAKQKVEMPVLAHINEAEEFAEEEPECNPSYNDIYSEQQQDEQTLEDGLAAPPPVPEEWTPDTAIWEESVFKQYVEESVFKQLVKASNPIGSKFITAYTAIPEPAQKEGSDD